MEDAIAFPDRAQGHVHGLPDEVPFVSRFPFDERQALDKSFVTRLLIVHRKTPKERKGRALDKLLLAAAGVRRSVKQV